MVKRLSIGAPSGEKQLTVTRRSTALASQTFGLQITGDVALLARTWTLSR